MKRKWITRADVCVLLALLFVVAMLYFLLFSREKGDTVSVYVGNTLHGEFSLADAPDTYTVTTEKGSLTLAFALDGICVLHSDCPDGICVRTGKITRKGESIVCAPLGVCVTLGEATLDGVTG